MSLDLIKRMYWHATSGRVALFAFVLVLCIPLAHFFGGAPPISELRIVEGVVADIQARNGLKRTMDLELTVNGEKGSERLHYMVNPGDNALSGLSSLQGRPVRAWIGRTYESTIYQLESGDQRVIDYETRNRQLSGDPLFLLIYFCVALGTFVFLSVKRYTVESKRQASSATP